MDIDVIVPVARRGAIDRLLYAFSRNTVKPDVITLVSNELRAADVRTCGLNVRLLRFTSRHYAIGSNDVALRRNAGIWASSASHVVTFDDDQLAPPDLVATARALLAQERFFWGHYRYIDFSRCPIDELLALPPGEGRPREFPPNSLHLFRSAYAGLFGSERSLVVEAGGFDMRFSGRHGGEDQDLGRRLALQSHGAETIFVHEPPFAWHSEQRIPWDEDRYSNLCSGPHDSVIDPADGIHRCTKCPYFWAPDELLFQPEPGERFDPDKVEMSVEPCL